MELLKFFSLWWAPALLENIRKPGTKCLPGTNNLSKVVISKVVISKVVISKVVISKVFINIVIVSTKLDRSQHKFFSSSFRSHESEGDEEAETDREK